MPDDSLTFSIINLSDGSASPVREKIVFTQDAVLGTFSSPYAFVLVDEVPPVVNSAFHYSTEASLAHYLKLFISTNEPLLRSPFVQITSGRGGNSSMTAQPFNENKNIYVLDYTVEDMGQNTFFITVTDFGENVTQQKKELNVQSIQFSGSVAFSPDPDMHISMKSNSVQGEGLLFCETLPSVAREKLPAHMEMLSRIYDLRSGVDLAGTIQFRYHFVKPEFNEETARKIGLYRWDEEHEEWLYTSGQGNGNVVKARADEYGTYAVFYNDKMIPVPEEYALYQNFPNPFNPSTTFRFDIPEDSRVKLEIYNILGQKVFTLLNADMEAGYHKATWNGMDATGRKMASGIYIYKLKAGTFTKTRKMILLK
jgi:hypothetical protein